MQRGHGLLQHYVDSACVGDVRGRRGSTRIVWQRSVSHVSDLTPRNSGGLTSICCRSMSLSPLAWSSRLDST